MELRRRKHELLPPQVGARQVDPREKQDGPEQSADALEMEKSGGDSRHAVVDGGGVNEEALVMDNKRSSVKKDSNQENLTWKKRAADTCHEDLVWGRSLRQHKICTNQALSIREESANITMRSDPQNICHFKELLNEPQWKKVKELGFGSLLDFRMNLTGLRDLVSWLMDHLFPDKQNPEVMVLYFGDNKELYITQHTVECVMGLQKGKIDPPLMLTETHKLNGLKLLREKLGVPAGEPIGDGYLKKQIRSGSTDTFTMQCFMMLVFYQLMACNTCEFITENAWNMVNTDFDKFGYMNWCKFIFDQVRDSEKKWKEGRKKAVLLHGCPAFIVIYYLDNLDCEHTMRCAEIPRARFFSEQMIQKLVTADMQENGLPAFGKLPLRNQRGTCYDEGTELSRHLTKYMPIPGTIDTDIVGCFRSLHNQIEIGDLSCHQILCPPNKSNGKQQLQHHDITQIEEQEGRSEENGDGQQTTVCNSSEWFVHHQTDGDIAMVTQGTTLLQEASIELNDDPEEDVVQLASSSMKEQVNNFMGGSSEPGILQKLDSLLPQIRASLALGVRASDLEHQVQELTKKLGNKEEELQASRETLREVQSTLANKEELLEGIRANLRTPQLFQLDAQSAVAAINCLALRLSATFVRLGSDPPSPSGVVSSSSSSLEEAVKLLEDMVSRIELMARSHATSLARSSVAFGAAALLCRGRKKGVNVQSLHNPVNADTRRFVQSQGPEFHSLVAQVVDAVQKQHGENDDANTRP